MRMSSPVFRPLRFTLGQAVVQLYGTCEDCAAGKAPPTRHVSSEALFARDALRIAIATERSGPLPLPRRPR